MHSILFVCTANQCRSPVAAELFNACVEDSEITDWLAESAGTWTKSGQVVEERSLQLASSMGVDLGQYRTRSIEDIDLGRFDQVVVMEKGHLESLVCEYPDYKRKINLVTLLAGMAGSDIPDPLLFDYDSAVGILRDLRECIHRIHQKLALGENQPAISKNAGADDCVSTKNTVISRKN